MKRALEAAICLQLVPCISVLTHALELACQPRLPHRLAASRRSALALLNALERLGRQDRVAKRLPLALLSELGLDASEFMRCEEGWKRWKSFLASRLPRLRARMRAGASLTVLAHEDCGFDFVSMRACAAPMKVASDVAATAQVHARPHEHVENSGDGECEACNNDGASSKCELGGSCSVVIDPRLVNMAVALLSSQLVM